MITYKVLKTNDEMDLVQKVEQVVWGTSPIPTHQTLTAVKHGGTVIGAFDGDKIVGFCYGFAGFENGQVSLCSHMLGILPEYREGGVGEELKRQQKQLATTIGYERMTWTYDPLQTRNAYLNLTKLHGVCDTYIEDCYGKMEDGLNGGLPSDRFQIDWWITSDYVNQFVKKGYDNPKELAAWLYNDQHLPNCEDFDSEGLTVLKDVAYLVPVPADITSLKEHDLNLAIEWRLKTRQMFKALFQAGYVAIELVKSNDEPVHHYLVVKKNTVNIPQ
ncbi:GNAT family N-acetyltransferase [Rummeliibacillus pycnus]|uniref:GNAT family N-acetyltransferase n=1 Tax=Rummeliibacillus pycnus TaxID=101070 RepID=UPI0037CA7C03